MPSGLTLVKVDEEDVTTVTVTISGSSPYSSWKGEYVFPHRKKLRMQLVEGKYMRYPYIKRYLRNA